MSSRLSVAALAALLLVAAPSSAPPPPSRIVFAAAPVATAWGEIYRVDADGTKVDLSDSPAPDLAPAVSPDGKHVAFVSARGGHGRVYVVGIDGSGLRALSPELFRTDPGDADGQQASWSPDSRRIAVEIGSALSLTTLGGGWRTIARNAVGERAVWSRDGARLAYGARAGLVDVVDARTGRRLWRRGGEGVAGWSRDGRLAVQQDSATIAVYSRRGKLLSTYAGANPAWSPDARVLASVRGGMLQLRTDGTGRPTLGVRVAPKPQQPSVQWLTGTTLRVSDLDGWFGYDVARRRRFALPPGASQFDSVAAPGGRAYAYVGYSRDTRSASLVLGTRTLDALPTCGGDDTPYTAIQFVAKTSSLVYQTGCPLPSADIYSIAPDGTGLQRLTSTPEHEFDPALSPDGRRVAYDQEPAADRCDGCAESLWVTPPVTQLTSPKDTDEAPYDADPSFSPDGSTIVFDRSGAATPTIELYTISAAGGPVHDLRVAGVYPAWGPRLIAFVPWNAKTPAIDTLDPSTGAVATAVAGKSLNVGALAWSTDGRLAYLAYDARGSASIHVVGSDAQPVDVSALLPSGSRVVDLAWSPDGSRFAFVAQDANGLGELYTIGGDGTGLTQVTRNAGAVLFGSSISWR